MVTKIIDLDLKDPNIVPAIHVSKLDSGLRAFEFHLYDGDAIYQIPSNVSITIQGTKPDKNGFVYGCSYTQSTGVVIANCAEQMTTVVGDVVCQLVLVDTNNERVASFVFILVVHKSATDSNTVYSDSDLAYANEVLNNLQSVGAYADALNNLNTKVNRIQMTYISSEERINFNNPA